MGGAGRTGVAVLAWAQTQIFEIYYFRMYCALVGTAAAHSLVLLPVLLALVGPPPLLPPRASTDNLSLQARAPRHLFFPRLCLLAPPLLLPASCQGASVCISKPVSTVLESRNVLVMRLI